MKNLFTTIAIALLINSFSTTCFAQWTSVYQDTQAQFYDAAFPSDHVGFVAASDTGGTVVLRTTDGGATWNKKYIHGWDFISKIAMIDTLTGYIIKGGVPGKILKTTDGFNTFTTHYIDSSFIVQALCVLNDSTGFYLNNAARLRKFEHNGSSFTHVIDTLVDGQNLQFLSLQTGFLDTGNGLLITSDGGVSWHFVNTNLGFYCVTFSFANSLNGYFSDGTVIYKTTNGGISFPLQYNFPHTYSFAVYGNNCMAANDTGNVAYTTNGGLTWQNETTGINYIASEPYKVITTPGGQYYLFSQSCGEIRKRLDIVSGIPTLSSENNMLVYPNPFTSQTTVSFGKQQTNTLVRISDLLGREIKTINFSGRELIIHREEMNKGIYIMTVTDNKNNHINTKISIR